MVRLIRVVILIYIVVFLTSNPTFTTYAQDKCTANGYFDASLNFSPDGKYIAAYWDKGTVRLWETKTGKVLHNYATDPKAEFAGLEISPDNKLILADMRDHAILWDVETEAIK